jgi:hypothetical protein
VEEGEEDSSIASPRLWLVPPRFTLVLRRESEVEGEVWPLEVEGPHLEGEELLPLETTGRETRGEEKPEERGALEDLPPPKLPPPPPPRATLSFTGHTSRREHASSASRR